MEVWIHLTHDEVHRKIPYQLIAETTGGARWDTGKRRRMFAQAFTETERRRISELRKKATTWALVKGVPLKGVNMAKETYRLWQRLGDFCASL